MPSPPTASIHAGTADLAPRSAPPSTEPMAASGPIALATSFDPCANATAAAVIMPHAMNSASATATHSSGGHAAIPSHIARIVTKS